MEPRCVFIFLIVSLVNATPHGYGVKSGASAKAEATASAGVIDGLSQIPVSVPGNVGSYSGSFSQSSASSFASSSSSASANSFSYSGGGSGGLTAGAGSNGYASGNNCANGACSGDKGDAGTLSGSTAGDNKGPLLIGTSNSGAGASAGSYSGSSSNYNPSGGLSPCSGSECSKPCSGASCTSPDSSKNCDSGICKTGEVGSIQTDITSVTKPVYEPSAEVSGQEYNSNDQSGNSNGVAAGTYNKPGSTCSFGSCGSTVLSDSKPSPAPTYLSSNKKPPVKPDINLQPPCLTPNCNGFNNPYAAASGQVDNPSYGKPDSTYAGQSTSQLTYPENLGTNTLPSSYDVPSYTIQNTGCSGANCHQQQNGANQYTTSNYDVPKSPALNTPCVSGSCQDKKSNGNYFTPTASSQETSPACTSPHCLSSPDDIEVPIKPHKHPHEVVQHTSHPSSPEDCAAGKCVLKPENGSKLPTSSQTFSSSQTGAIFPHDFIQGSTYSTGTGLSESNTQAHGASSASSSLGNPGYSPSIPHAVSPSISVTIPTVSSSYSHGPSSTVSPGSTGSVSSSQSLPSYLTLVQSIKMPTSSPSVSPYKPQAPKGNTYLSHGASPSHITPVNSGLGSNPHGSSSYTPEKPETPSNFPHSKLPADSLNAHGSISNTQIPVGSNIYLHGTSVNPTHCGSSQCTESVPSPNSISGSIPVNKPITQKLPVYTGGFGGPSGFLKPNDFNVPSKPGYFVQHTPAKIPAPILTVSKSVVQNTLPNNAHAVANAAASSNAVVYKGNFGGPPGFLKPYDSAPVGAVGYLGKPSLQYEFTPVSKGIFGNSQTSAIDNAKPGAFNGGYGPNQGSEEKNVSGCKSGCGSDLAHSQQNFEGHQKTNGLGTTNGVSNVPKSTAQATSGAGSGTLQVGYGGYSNPTGQDIFHGTFGGAVSKSTAQAGSGALAGGYGGHLTPTGHDSFNSGLGGAVSKSTAQAGSNALAGGYGGHLNPTGYDIFNSGLGGAISKSTAQAGTAALAGSYGEHLNPSGHDIFNSGVGGAVSKSTAQTGSGALPGSYGGYLNPTSYDIFNGGLGGAVIKSTAQAGSSALTGGYGGHLNPTGHDIFNSGLGGTISKSTAQAGSAALTGGYGGHLNPTGHDIFNGGLGSTISKSTAQAGSGAGAGGYGGSFASSSASAYASAGAGVKQGYGR